MKRNSSFFQPSWSFVALRITSDGIYFRADVMPWREVIGTRGYHARLCASCLLWQCEGATSRVYGALVRQLVRQPYPGRPRKPSPARSRRSQFTYFALSAGSCWRLVLAAISHVGLFTTADD
jgi:hypothetical protein